MVDSVVAAFLSLLHSLVIVFCPTWLDWYGVSYRRLELVHSDVANDHMVLAEFEMDGQ